MSNFILFSDSSRGYADHGWLKSHHTFSFANYRNSDRIHFGVLRVFNDDFIDSGMGFGTHPHQNMEIITIPLSGDLAHKDSMGNGTIIRQGDIQVMSAGTGIEHSEYNANDDKPVEILQLWLFPKTLNVTPRYEQKTMDKSGMHNQLLTVLTPNPTENAVWIHQDAWFYLSDLDAGKKLEYQLQKADNAVFVFVISGSLEINGQKLNRRDAIGFTDTEKFEITAQENTQLLLMEFPEELPSFYQ
ncbi:pirin family protein [Flavobacterium sp. HSC-61S13]|uniref:pirin family protein n=1 Tax=Flavobacterium sp. HSC-61S13 TaxID=2910963 RepID=UPI00209DF31D|nr:pirin family protein [Flavobacterium sp. HSC-61S13]MCP1995419.1 redox-sensitive bicupin YhaK (pirin superfamily) [Flavobacterium sp. HSC-61S13]